MIYIFNNIINMDEISLYISKDTIDQRKYLKEFFKKLELLKSQNNKVDAYKLGMTENYNFWSEMYEDDKLPKKMPSRTYIKIGKEYQADI